MAMQDSTTNFSSYKFSDLASKMSTADSAVATAVGDLIGEDQSLFSTVANIYDGGFAGMSKTGIQDLKNHINQYANDLQKIIDGYDAEADITGGLAEGSKAQIAASDFIKDIKVLLDAYISTLKTYAEDAETAYNNYVGADTSIGASVDQTGSDVQSAAANVKLD